MVSESVFSDWLDDLIAFQLALTLSDDIIHHEFVPVFLSFIEQNAVAEVKQGDIVIMEVLMDKAIINHKLLG